jgi:rhodanese-related sulfurtransferase
LVRIVEVDVSPAAFDGGHIPGAIFWNAYGDLRPVDYRPLPPSEFARLLSRSGIGPDTAVVFYGYAAYLGYWLLRSSGHSNVFLMDGPRERWLEAGHAWAGENGLATREEVLGLIGDPDAVLLDVRSREEFAGERFWPSGGMQEGGRAGHIPGAVWLPVDIAQQGPYEIRDACEAAGVTLRLVGRVGDRARLPGPDGGACELAVEAAGGQEARHGLVGLAGPLELGHVAAVELHVLGRRQLLADVAGEGDRHHVVLAAPHEQGLGLQ